MSKVYAGGATGERASVALLALVRALVTGQNCGMLAAGRRICRDTGMGGGVVSRQQNKKASNRRELDAVGASSATWNVRRGLKLRLPAVAQGTLGTLGTWEDGRMRQCCTRSPNRASRQTLGLCTRTLQ